MIYPLPRQRKSLKLTCVYVKVTRSDNVRHYTIHVEVTTLFATRPLT